MNKGDLIAIIVPAYRVGHLLTRSISSLLCQTYSNIEVWIVDDGSDEGTGEVADGMARVDRRVHILHQRNKKGYLARLMGLQHIHASWFGFVDADDFVEPTMYERLHTFAVQNDLEVVQCDQFCKGQNVPELFLTREQVFGDYVWPRLFCGEGAVFVWDKLYKNIYDFSCFEHVPVQMFDDMILNLYLFEQTKRFGLLHEGLYHYTPNAQSSVKNYKRQNLSDFLLTVAFRRKMAARYEIVSSEIVLDTWIVRNARNLLLSAMRAPLATGEEREQNIFELCSICLEQISTRVCRTRDMLGNYWFLCVARRFPRITCLVVRMLDAIRVF